MQAKRWRTLALALWASVGCACAAPANFVCVPGSTQPCVCPGARIGAQRCSDEGARWELCLCDPTDPRGDASVDARTSTPDALVADARTHDAPPTDAASDSGALASDGPMLDGAALYTRLCATCHGPHGEGVSPRGPAISREVRGESDRDLRRLFATGEDDMPPVPMTDEEAAALIAYLRERFGPYEED
ncbi:MAG: cytochrome c [Myxococcales bacterium]|nr:cytochrome c [Myxococcales bacterium]